MEVPLEGHQDGRKTLRLADGAARLGPLRCHLRPPLHAPRRRHVRSLAHRELGRDRQEASRGKQAKLNPDYVKHPAFGARLTIYKKTGEILKKYDMCDLLQPKEWIYVNWVQGNLYWLMEYPDVMKNGEPARCGWRYYRVSPDYSTLEFVIGPNQDAANKIRSEPREVREYRRTVRVRLSDGVVLDADAQISDVNKIPVRPFCDALIKRGDAKGFQASLDPIRVAGRFVVEKGN